jgi:PAS domain S-box-containing protein
MKDLEQSNKELVNEPEFLRQRIEELEATLRSTMQDWRIVADFTYDWEYWITASGQLQYVSPSCERITGYSPNEFTEDPCLLERIVHPDDRGFAEMHMFEDVNNPEALPQAIDFRIVDRNGAVRWIGHVCQSVFGDLGEWRGRRCSNRDITERKKAEEQKESLLVNLQEALAKIKTLSGFLPICASCKKIRDDEGYWHQIESYIRDHSDAEFSHGICPSCAKKLYPDFYGNET